MTYSTVEVWRKRHGISRGLAYSLIKRGEIAYVRLGGKLLIADDAMERKEHPGTRTTVSEFILA